MVIEVNKDIDRYQESVAMGLTARQLIFSIASVVVGGGIVLLLYKYIGLTGSAYVAIPCVAPIALGGFYSFNGMNFYEYMGKKLHFMFGNKALTYVSTEGEPAIKAFGCKCSECVNLACTKRHCSIQSVRLLIFQNGKLTQVLSCYRKQSFGVIIKLLLAVRSMNQREYSEHHSLITSGEVIKELFHFLFLLFHIIRNGSGKVVVLILLSLPVGDIGFHTEKSAFRFLFTLWKRVRKYGAFATGITQNVDDLLQSHTARTMLANSEFLIMLNQASTDRLELAKLLNISDRQLSYITNVDAGHGLIKVGSSLVPFANKFPKNTKLYKLMTTKPGEGA